MTVNVTCWCGAEISIDDASELASAAIVTAFYAAHPHGHAPWSRYNHATPGTRLPIIGER